MDDEEFGKEQMVELADKIDEYNKFLELSLQDLIHLAPFEGDEENLRKLMEVAIRSSGTGAAFDAVAQYGPEALSMMLMAEGERLEQGIQVKRCFDRGNKQFLDKHCVGCPDKDTCDLEVIVEDAPTQADGTPRLLH